MTDYSKLSDFEINRAVAEKKGGFLAKDIFEKEQTVFIWHPCNKYSKFDPCNSWADAGPIAEKSRIGTMPSSGGTHMAWATSVGMLGDKQAHSEKLCRAICIVFLMMNEGE